MEDREIVALYWERDERAIGETQKKYGALCHRIAYNILQNRQDAEECENDTYLEAWNSIPPQRPRVLSSFLAVIARRRSLDLWRRNHAQKRGGFSRNLSFDELEGCIPSGRSIAEEASSEALAHALSDFLRTLGEEERGVFMRRYWYCDSVKEIARRMDCGQSKIKMMLKRMRERLSAYLEQEGYFQ